MRGRLIRAPGALEVGPVGQAWLTAAQAAATESTTRKAPTASLGRCHPAATTATPNAEPNRPAPTAVGRSNRRGTTSIAAIATDMPTVVWPEG